MNNFYSIPTAWQELPVRNALKKVNLKTSIDQNIELLLISQFYSFAYDANYGSCIWSCDFEPLPTIKRTKHQLERLLVDALNEYEPRIRAIEIDIKLLEEPYFDKESGEKISIRKLLTVNVKGVIKATDEIYTHPEINIYFSPVTKL